MKSFFLINHRGKKPLLKKKKNIYIYIYHIIDLTDQPKIAPPNSCPYHWPTLA